MNRFMHRRCNGIQNKLIFLIILLVCILLLSCASCASVNRNGVPRWYYNPQSWALSSEIAFIGEGRAIDERGALLLAYADLNSRLYGYLGMAPSDESYKQLTTLGTISEFGLRIVERYQQNASGGYDYYVLALANKSKVMEGRSSNAMKEGMIAEEAKKLIFEGDELMKNGYDVLALKKYLESMVLTYPLSRIESEYSFSVMLEEVLDIISTIRIELRNVDELKGSCDVSVLRRDSVISTEVKNAPIRANFTAEDYKRDLFTDSVVLTTDEEGLFVFTPKNNLMSRQGTVVFYVDIDKEIDKLSHYSDPIAQRIKAVSIASGSRFNYSLEYSSADYGLAFLELSDIGLYTNAKGISKEISKLISLDNIKNYLVDKTQVFSEDPPDYKSLDAELLEDFHIRNGYLVIGRVAPVSIVFSKNDVCICTLQTRLNIYNTKTKEVIYDGGTTYINGFAPKIEEAIDDAYTNYVNFAYSVLKNHYV